MITIKIQTKDGYLSFSARKIILGSTFIRANIVYGAVQIPELLHSFKAPNGSLILPDYMSIEVE